jgi:hypothetical protein
MDNECFGRSGSFIVGFLGKSFTLPGHSGCYAGRRFSGTGRERNGKARQSKARHATFDSALLLFLNLYQNENFFEITKIENRRQLQQTLKILFIWFRLYVWNSSSPSSIFDRRIRILQQFLWGEIYSAVSGIWFSEKATPSNLIGLYQYVGGNYCLYLQGITPWGWPTKHQSQKASFLEISQYSFLQIIHFSMLLSHSWKPPFRWHKSGIVLAFAVQPFVFHYTHQSLNCSSLIILALIPYFLHEILRFPQTFNNRVAVLIVKIFNSRF